MSRLTSLSFPALLGAALTVASACVDEPKPEAPADDSMPLVEGLQAIEDKAPALDEVRYEITVAATDVKLADKPVKMLTYNGTVPGPLLQARVGDHVHIVVTNELDEPTTIHWHGMRVPNDMDGVVDGNLQPIAPGESFEYHFHVEDAGTFWFHPHIRTNVQIEKGLQGMFVVHEKDDAAPDVDHDRALVLDDVLVNDAGDLETFASGGMEIMHGRYGNMLLVNGKADVDTLTFAPGQVERWRLVNTANARTMVVRFPGLEVKQIGADGGLWPQSFVSTIDELELPVGARAELEVRRVAAAGDAASAGMVSVVPTLDANNNVVEIELPLLQVALDDTLEPSARAGYTANPSIELLNPVDENTHDVTISGYNQAGQVHFTINGHAWPDTESWSVPQGTVETLVIKNQLGMEHPFHLHGHFFQVLSRSAGGLLENGWRDTVLVGGQETVKIVVRFDNPGMWMYHCHNLEHEENGMMSMVTVVGDGEEAAH
jgi:FtsP/CotA-like multicopper oxidase with cupredoxin domain